MNSHKFLDTLVKYYNYPIRGTHAKCKFYLQASTFSFEIHDIRETCFTNKSLVFESGVYWWGSNRDNKEIIADIRRIAKEKLPKNLDLGKLLSTFA